MNFVDLLGYVVVFGLVITLLLSTPKIGQKVGVKILIGALAATCAAYAAYEMLMPENMNIRVDRFILWPGFVVVVVCVLIRVKKLQASD